MTTITKLSQFLFRHVPSWQLWRIKKYWQKEFEPFINKSEKLSVSQLSELYAFWGEYEKINPLFHTFYTQKTGDFKVNYLPDDIFYPIIDRYYNNADLALQLDDKSLYESLLKDPNNIVKFPTTICIKSGGFWLKPTFEPISYSKVMLLVKEAGEIFIKCSVESWGGKGVVLFDPKKNTTEEFEKIVNSLGPNLVIQKRIKQSPILAALNKSSVNTLRLISFLKSDGSVKIYSVVLRMGLKGAVVDNASSGGITVGVKDNGRLKNIAYTYRGKKYEKYHPDSNVEFESIVIPNYDIIRDAVKRLHYRLPKLRLLSWDFALDENDNPILIEVNMSQGQLDFHQLNNGPLFGDDTQTILDEVYGKNSPLPPPYK